MVWHLRILPSLEVSQLVISSMRTDSVTLWVVWALLSPWRYYNAFEKSQASKQGAAGMRKHVASIPSEILNC